MNETRKQIIELIGDYMDKTLSEGCLIEDLGETGIYGANQVSYNNYKVSEITKYQHSNKMRDGEILLVDIDFDQILYVPITQIDEDNSMTILGHYDITSVLKYIRDIQCDAYINITYYEDRIELQELIIGEAQIPNKPLYLYTEQEEKDLLELLNKLKG